ncbi:hypothetical protein AGMMS50239_34670 [Bacteroidia bacterium]|nr:hypothetical protein AGMMS50239_34670 [Bacteroidia bacterium]
MEIEDLKTIWASVDEQLKKQEVLKESLIKDMIYKKTNKSLNILLWAELPGIPVILLLLPFIVYAYQKFGGRHIMWDSMVIFCGAVCTVMLPYLIYKAYLLTKIDLSDNIRNNLLYINRFNILIKKEKTISIFFSAPVYTILILYYYIYQFFNCIRIVSVMIGLSIHEDIKKNGSSPRAQLLPIELPAVPVI